MIVLWLHFVFGTLLSRFVWSSTGGIMNYSYRALAHAHSIKRSITNQNIEIGANVHMCVEKNTQSNGFIEPSNSCIQKRFVRAIQYVFYGCSFWLLSPHVLNIYINCCLNSTPTPVQAMRCGAIVRISYYRKWTNNNGKTHNQKLSMDVNGK